MSEHSVLGKRVPRVDGRVKATGEAKYTVDLVMPRMLYGRTLRSPYPHAKIININTSKAERLLGVKAVITGDDIRFTRGASGGSAEPALAIDKVCYIGEGVVVVAATDEDIAEEALDLIDVTYEPLPAVFDPIEAMKDGAPIIHDGKANNIATKLVYNFGDVDRGFKECDYIQEDRLTTPSVHSAYMEPLVCISSFDSSGRLTIWTTHQSLSELRNMLATQLVLELGNVRVIAAYVGGGHCGKNELLPHHVCSAILSRKADRPVKMELSRHEIFTICRGAQPLMAEIRTGVKKDGTLVASECKLIANFGAYYRARPLFSWLFGIALTLPYRLPNVRYEGYSVYTNNPLFVSEKGSGITPARYVQEVHLDRIAEALGIDPAEIRLRNAVQPGDVSACGLKVSNCGLTEAIQKAMKNVEWKERKGRLSDNHGLGIACWVHPTGGPEDEPFDTTAAFVHVHRDGTVTLITSSAELGQGLATVFAQIVAEELGVAVEDVRLSLQDTDIGPISIGSSGSRATCGAAGPAVRKAALDARRQVLEVAAKRLEVLVDDLQLGDRRVYVKANPDKGVAWADLIRDELEAGKVILGKGYYNSDVDRMDWRTGKGNIASSYSFGCQISEVEVDTETGQVRVCKHTVAADVGFALNPMNVEGQVEQQVVQGIGRALYEEQLFEKGATLNPSFLDYTISRSVVIPKIDTIIVETEDPGAPLFGAKECGEGPLGAVAPSIVNAVYDAVGVRITDLTLTPEKVLKALKKKEKK